MSWQDGVLTVLLSSPQEHWHSWIDGSGLNSGPTGCSSTNLTEPGARIEPSWMSVDYGECGAVDWPRPAEIVLFARCADCDAEVTESFEVDDDPVDLHLLLTLLEEKPTRQALSKRLYES